MNLSKSNIKKLCGLILFAIVAYVVIQNPSKILWIVQFLWSVIFPFALGLIIAYILNIPMMSIERRLFKTRFRVIKNADGTERHIDKKYVRPLGILITFILLIAVLSGILLIIIPQTSATTVELVRTANAFFPRAQKWILARFAYNESVREFINSVNFDLSKIIDTAIDFLKNGAGNVLTGTVSAAKAVVSGITSFVIGLIFSFYLLSKKETLLRQINMLIDAVMPDKAAQKVRYIAKISNETFSSFIAGQCLEALILGLMFFIVLAIVRIPYALLISVLIAVTSLIPVFGAFIGCVVGAFLILMVSPVQALIFIGIFLVLQQIEGNLIYPKVVGGSIGLPSVWVLAAITIGSSLMGIAGMLFFIPLTSVVYTLLREWTYKRLAEKHIAAPAQPTENNDISDITE